MRIGFFGDGPWAVLALKRLSKLAGLDVAVVVGRSPDPDSELKALAESLGVKFHSPQNVNDPDYLHALGELSCDFHVSMSYDQIFRPEFLRSARDGAINCHAGLLPFYRGRNPLNWALINNESEVGITVHEVAFGIDTGDIILQRKLPIHPSSDYASLLKDAQTACADVLVEAVRLKMSGRVEPIKQSSIHPIGFYVGRRRPGDEIIEWSLSAERIHNFVRALVPPGPAARTNIGDSHFAVLRTALIPEAPAYIATEGEVVGHTNQHLIVKTGDTTLAVGHVATIDKDGRLGEPFTPRWPIGTRLGRDTKIKLENLDERVARLEARCPYPKIKQDIVVLGAGGFARVLVEALMLEGAKIRGYVTNEIGEAIWEMAPLDHLGDDRAVFDLDPSDVLLANGIGTIGGIEARREAFFRFRDAGFRFATVVHPSAIVGSDVTIGEGAHVMARAVLQVGTSIGENAIIGMGALVDHDVSIGNHVHVGSGVCLASYVTVSESVVIGVGAKVSQSRQIGDRASIGAGTVVVTDVPANAALVGILAKSVGRAD